MFKTDGSPFKLFYDATDEIEAYQLQFSIYSQVFPQITNLAQITAQYIATISPNYIDLPKVPAYDMGVTTLLDIRSTYPFGTDPDYKNFIQVVMQQGQQGQTERQVFTTLGALTWNDLYQYLTTAQKTLLMIP